MWILQTDTDILTGDLELIAAHLLEELRPPADAPTGGAPG